MVHAMFLRHEIGLHSSYHAVAHPQYLQQEREQLTSATAQPELISIRQHYLRWYERITPELFATESFAIDSTLGFADHEGFRLWIPPCSTIANFLLRKA